MLPLGPYAKYFYYVNMIGWWAEFTHLILRVFVGSNIFIGIINLCRIVLWKGG